MKLVVLGTAGYHPNEHRQTTSVVIPEAGIVLDAGTSLFRLPQYLETSSIDILLTHAHLDHVVGLTYLLDILYQHPLDEVRVHGETAKLASIHSHLFSKDLFPVEPPYVEKPLDGEMQIGGATIQHISLNHPGGSVGYRMDWPDRSIAFITDTTAAVEADYVNRIRGVDLLIHECNFTDGMEELAEKTGHSCLSSVIAVANRAEVGALVLLHFNPLTQGMGEEDIKRANGVFDPIVLAEDGMEIEF